MKRPVQSGCRFLEILPASHIHILPGVYRQAHAARALSRDAADDSEEQGRSLLQAVLELILCKLQVPLCVLHA